MNSSSPEIDRAVGVVLLAAGRSQRFGGDKLTASFRGKPLWQWSAEACEKAGFRRRFVVVGDQSRISDRPGWQRVINHRSFQGMGTSIASGVKAAAQSCSRIVIALADMPLIEPAHLRRLADMKENAFTLQVNDVAGCPAAFMKSAFQDLMGLDGDSGARSLKLQNVVVLPSPQVTTLTDIDTPAELIAVA